MAFRSRTFINIPGFSRNRYVLWRFTTGHSIIKTVLLKRDYIIEIAICSIYSSLKGTQKEFRYIYGVCEKLFAQYFDNVALLQI